MIVVPTLPEGQQSHNPLVMAAIVRLELALAKGVADGIDTKSYMVLEENTHQPTPQQTGPATNHERYPKRQHQPEQEGAIHKDHDRILQQIAAVHLGIGETVFEEPAKMCMKEALNRTMWIALPIRLRMMLDVRGSILNGRPFYCHGAKDQQDHLHDRMGAEAAMGQHAMVANRQAESSEHVHCCQQCQVGPVNSPLPKHSYRQNSTEEGNDHHCKDIRFGVRHRFHKTSINVVARNTMRTRFYRDGITVTNLHRPTYRINIAESVSPV